MNTTTRENFQRLIETVKALPAIPTAVAHPCDESSLAGALDAAKLGIIEPILVGPGKGILAAAAQRSSSSVPCGCGGLCAWGARADYPHQPRRFGTEPARFVRRRGGGRGPSPCARGEGELT
jgi:hypothetical protein